MRSILVISLLISVALCWNCNRFDNKLVNITGDYTNLKGFVHEACLPLADVLDGLFDTQRGFAMSTYFKACKVMDVYGGNRTDDGEPWEYDTLSNTYSAGKGLHAIAVGMMQDEVDFSYQDSIQEYWPEFNLDVALEIVFSYRTCRIATNENYTSEDTFDTETMDALLAGITHYMCAPNGSFAAYEPVIPSYDIDGFIRRTHPEELNLEQFLRDKLETADGLEEFEFYYTNPPDERVTKITNDAYIDNLNGLLAFLCSQTDEFSQQACRALINPIDVNMNLRNINNPANRNLYSPSAYTWTTARSLAALYGILGHKQARKQSGLISENAFNKAIKEVYRGPDYSAGGTGSYTRAGFEYPTESDVFSPSETAVGRTGLGRQIAFLDEEYKMGFALLNRFLDTDANPDSATIVQAAYDCIEAIRN